MSEIKRTERGWGAHFVCALRCSFRRNTLIEHGKRKVIISTIGGFRPKIDSYEIAPIGSCNRIYETMVFEAMKEGCYWDADVTKQLPFNSPWTINDFGDDSDERANYMHETVVDEIIWWFK